MNIMNRLSKEISRAVRLEVVLLAAISGVCFTNSVIAEEAEDQGEKVLEEVVVIGSRIKRPVDDTALPVTLFSAEDVKLTGEASVAEVLRRLPYNSFGSSTPTGSGGSTGQHVATVDLRGLGFGRTLTLLNGRRLPPDGTFFAFDTNLNFIPSATIERIEVLRGGGSPVYGSDALGGVLNVVLKDNYEGGEVNVQYGSPFDIGGDEVVVGGLYGLNFDRGNLTISAEYRDIGNTQRGEISALAAGPDLGFGYISSGFPTTFNILDAFGDGTDISSPLIAAPNCDPSRIRSTAGAIITNPDTMETITYANTTECRFNNNDDFDFTADTELLSLFMRGNYDLSDSMTLFAEVLYSELDTDSNEGARTIFGLTMASTDPNNPTAAATPSNPLFGVTGPRNLSFNLTAPTPGLNIVETEQILATIGLTWETSHGTLEASYNWSESEGDQTFANTQSTANIQAAIDSGILNPFGTAQNARSAFANGASAFLRHSIGELEVFNINWNGAITALDLATGTPLYSIGYEYRQESYFEEGSGDGFGQGFNDGFALPADNERNVDSVFTELIIPLGQSLEFSWAGRWDSYDLPDFSELTNRYALAWQALSGLNIRASLSEGIAAPNLFFVGSGTTQLVTTAVDTLRCNEAGNDPSDPACQPVSFVQTIKGGSALAPETADNYNLGFSWGINDNWTLSVDYWKVELEDQVANLNSGTVLELEASGADLSSYGVSVTRDANGMITALTSGSTNVTGFETDGYDVGVTYNNELADIGEFSSSLLFTWIDSYDRAAAPGQPVLSAIGYRGQAGSLPGGPEYKGVWSNNLRTGNLLYNVALNFLDGYDGRTPEQALIQQVPPIGDVSKFITVDASVTWSATEHSDLYVGFRNILDEEPTVSRTIFGTGAFDQANSSILGRVLSIRYTHRFTE
ncbi:TonB-dependent receptor [Porticoccaceae bacterium LTM1]|nr:TonB-dependent receptor [Porticoccaceae bacterium LTM1]